MSDTVDKLYQQVLAFAYIQIVTLSVFAWELITTLPMEVALYKTGITPTLLLLTFSRYYTLLCIILDVAFNLAIDASAKFCQDIRWILAFLSSTIQFVSLPLLLLRTYAIWGKNRFIAGFLVILWVGSLASTLR